MVTFDQVRKSLPKIGDSRHGGIVDYVNEDKFWYRVRFSWGAECYKAPKAQTKECSEDKQSKPLRKKPRKDMKYEIVETGKKYASFEEIGIDIGCNGERARSAYRRGKKCMKKWTIRRLKEGA